MKKIKTFLLVLCAIALTGCDMHKDYTNSENWINGKVFKTKAGAIEYINKIRAKK